MLEADVVARLGGGCATPLCPGAARDVVLGAPRGLGTPAEHRKRLQASWKRPGRQSAPLAAPAMEEAAEVPHDACAEWESLNSVVGHIDPPRCCPRDPPACRREGRHIEVTVAAMRGHIRTMLRFLTWEEKSFVSLEIYRDGYNKYDPIEPYRNVLCALAQVALRERHVGRFQVWQPYSLTIDSLSVL